MSLSVTTTDHKDQKRPNQGLRWVLMGIYFITVDIRDNYTVYISK